MNLFLAWINQVLDFRKILPMVADGNGALKEGNVTQKLALLRAHDGNADQEAADRCGFV